MTKTITGLIFVNDRKQCHAEMLTQLMQFTNCLEVILFRKVKNKDLFEYKCKITIS